MDRNLYTDDFERLLREKSDEFRMYPSKRTWSSIYNNIHPGRKWPSIAMSITLISALMLIGFLNTNTQHSELITSNLAKSGAATTNNAVNLFSQPFLQFNNYSDLQRIIPATSFTSIESETLKSTVSINDITAIQVPVAKMGLGSQNRFSLSVGVTNVVTLNEAASSNNEKLLPAINNIIIDEIHSTASLTSSNQHLKSTRKKTKEENIQQQQNASIYDLPGTITFSEDLLKTTSAFTSSLNNETAIIAASNIFKKTSISLEDQEWIDHYAMYNRPLPKKWAGKLSWSAYATPSVVYRTLNTDPSFGLTPTSAVPLVNPLYSRDINMDVRQKPSLGLEAGVGIQYAILKGVKFKTGLQLNFTRYNAIAYHNTHPVATKLTMHDYTTNSTYELYRTTPYSNKTGLEQERLHNETFQLSLPVGVDLRLLGNEAIQWNIGATIQPSYLLGGKSYLISSDRRNYVKESSMLNRWNLNAGFETFVTFKSNGITYQVGPQFRKQLFSTNSKNFAVQEKLINYGIKFGVVKLLK